MTKHKACPFCGAEWGGSYWEDTGAGYDDIMGALCDVCHASGPPVHLDEFETTEEAQRAAVMLWDKRPG